MLRRNLRRLQRYPSMTVHARRHADRVPAAVRLRLRGPARHRPPRCDGQTGRSGYLNYVVPGILLMTVAASVQGTAIVGRDGHDHRHHRPVPHHGHRPRRRAGRPRDRSHDPDASGPRHRDRRRASRSASGRPPTRARGSPPSACSRCSRFALVWLADRARARRQERRDRQQHPHVPRCCCPSSPAASCRPTPCPPVSGSSPSYQPFTPVTETVRGLLTGTPIGSHAILPSRGASASPSPRTCGRSASTPTANRADARAGRPRCRRRQPSSSCVELHVSLAATGAPTTPLSQGGAIQAPHDAAFIYVAERPGIPATEPHVTKHPAHVRHPAARVGGTCADARKHSRAPSSTVIASTSAAAVLSEFPRSTDQTNRYGLPVRADIYGLPCPAPSRRECSPALTAASDSPWTSIQPFTRSEGSAASAP